MRRHPVIGTVALAALAAAGWLAVQSAPPEAAPDAAAARYVGRRTCAGCHPAEDRRWRGSHHDLAMQEATAESALGDFSGVTLSHRGVTSKFFERDGELFVRTDGPGGELEDFRVAYTFGADPLQQYLAEFPGGRYQALPLAWDARPAADGGQRWFHLYPEEKLDAGDPLHWTGPNQNWNYMCAECHSTHLRKNYRPAEDRYQTTFAEIDVSCEACHGPGSRHLAWAQDRQMGARTAGGESGEDGDRGLEVLLGDRDGGAWVLDPATGTARRSTPRASRLELETCARCHSRRAPLDEGGSHGPLLDSHRPMLLDEALYHPDGQIDGEVYVYGSFLQSRMYHQGVTCGDCHEPHSLEVRGGSADAVCSTCHQPARFATPAHHFHAPESAGASCVDCHMPETTYMQVDPRRDHSLRIPRPDLSLTLGTPNACTDCHRDRSASWAADAVAGWYGKVPGTVLDGYGKVPGTGYGKVPGTGYGKVPGTGYGKVPGTVLDGHRDRSASWAADAVAGWYGKVPGTVLDGYGKVPGTGYGKVPGTVLDDTVPDAGRRRSTKPHYGEAIFAARRGRPGAGRDLAALADDPEQPAIARATALSLLRRYPGHEALQSIGRALADPEALVRLAAVTAAEIAPPEERWQLVFPLATDPLRALRVEAARVLATAAGDPAFAEHVPAGDRAHFETALDEYRQVQTANADRPEGQLNLGWLALSRAELDGAERHFRRALDLDPAFAAAYVNLAEIERLRDRDAEGERILRRALARLADDASLHHALGLVLVRRQRLGDAVAAFRRSVELAPDVPRYGHVLGAALDSLAGP